MTLKTFTLGLIIFVLLCGLGSALTNSDSGINPQSAEAWNHKGVGLDNLGRYEDALAAFDKALAINPQYAHAWYNKGNALYKLGMYEDALAAFDNATRINPQYAEAWNNKGSALGNLGRYEDALAAYDKALAINPQYAEAWQNKGNVLYKLGIYEDTLAAFDNATRINPQYAEAWVGKGSALGNLGRDEDALAAFDNATRINPQYAEAWAYKGSALGNLGRYEDALAAIDKALAINPQYSEAWNIKGIALSNLGRYEDALAAFDNALVINPQDAEALYNKYLNQKLGVYDQKISLYFEPSTGQIINQLELNVHSLDLNLISIKPNNIELNYTFQGKRRNSTFYLLNNSYMGNPIIVDLNQRNDFPFEDYNNTIYISTNDKNFSNKFFLNFSNESMTIDSWGQARRLNLFYEGNKIEITMERANKQISENLYYLGLAIIFSYLICFLIIYRKYPYTPDMFALFNTFSFLFFVALTIAGVRDYLFISKWGLVFLVLIFGCFAIFVYKIIKSRNHYNISEIKKEQEISELKEMLKRIDDKITEMKEMQRVELKQDEEGLKTE